VREKNCDLPTPEQIENRGLLWVVGAFAVCPCHLPLTLGVAAALLSGTTAAAVLDGHPYVSGAVISAVWGAATWRGVHLMNSARAIARSTPRTSPGSERA
jgi:hypothetical protein